MTNQIQKLVEDRKRREAERALELKRLEAMDEAMKLADLRVDDRLYQPHELLLLAVKKLHFRLEKVTTFVTEGKAANEEEYAEGGDPARYWGARCFLEGLEKTLEES